MNWKQYSKRRGGMSLEDFLIGCSSKQDAIDIFVSRQIEPPMDLLNKFYDPVVPEVVESTQQQVDTPVKKSKVVTSGTSTN